MSDDRVEAESYEPPTIDDRVPISLPLIGEQSAQGGGSAAFRPLSRFPTAGVTMSDDRAEAEPYEPPMIDDRVPISLPLIGKSV